MRNRLVELVDIMVSGDDMAQEDFMEYRKILYHSVKYISTSNIDDIISKITERLLTTYDVTKEIGQKKSFINNLITGWSTLYNYENTNPLGFSKYVIKKYGKVSIINDATPIVDYAEDVESAARVSFLRDTLSERDKILFDLLILGNSLDKDVAEVLNISTQWVNILKKDLIEKLKHKVDFHLDYSYL